MRIIIEYESSWRNQFLDGSNNEPIPKTGRKFVGSMSELKKGNNFKKVGITKDTVMGLLNRLIGEQRKLYQARSDEHYYFKTLEKKITFIDELDVESSQDEVIFIRNMTGSKDKNAFTGMIKANDPAFNSEFSGELWGILWLDITELLLFIKDSQFRVDFKEALDPIKVSQRLEFLSKEKPLDLNEQIQSALDLFKNQFPDVVYTVNDKNQFERISLYASALYLQLERLASRYDISYILTSSSKLSGISKRTFTKKDFMGNYTSGTKKIIWGNPYMLKQKIKNQGEVKQLLYKAKGKLLIDLNLTKEESIDLNEKINNAAVSSFYVGKKGLAYVTDIRL